MKSILLTFVIGLSIFSTSNHALAFERPPFTIEPSQGTLMVRDSDFGDIIHRQEIAADGTLSETNFVLDYDSKPIKWVVDTKQTFASSHLVSAETMARLSNPKWITDEEKIKYAEHIKPRVIVKNKPACDAGESTIKVLKKQTGIFVPVYKYTEECGEIEFIEINDIHYTRAVVMIFNLADSLRFMSK
jgi:hypothetical protein